MPKEADVKVTVSIKRPIAYRYIGEGAFFEMLPTRDVRADEIPENLTALMARAVELKLYEPVYEGETDAQSD